MEKFQLYRFFFATYCDISYRTFPARVISLFSICFHKKYHRTEHHHSRETTRQLTRSVLEEIFNMRNNKVVRTFEFLLRFMEAGCFV